MIFAALSLALLAASSLAQTTTVLTNDTRIIYSGPNEPTLTGVAWGNPGLDLTTYNDHTCGTGLIATTSLGAAATLLFTGTSVTVNFLTGQNAATVIVIIDDIPISLIDTVATNTVDHYYTCSQDPVTSGNLANGQHNITVIKSVTDGFMFLQDFVVTGQPISRTGGASGATAPAASGTGTYVSSATAGAGVISSAGTSNTNTASPPSSSSSSSSSSDTAAKAHKSSVPAIVGAIAGILVICVLAVAGIMYCRRRRNYDNQHYEAGPSTYATPFSPTGGHPPMGENLINGNLMGVNMTIEKIPSGAPHAAFDMSGSLGYKGDQVPPSPSVASAPSPYYPQQQLPSPVHTQPVSQQQFPNPVYTQPVPQQQFPSPVHTQPVAPAPTFPVAQPHVQPQVRPPQQSMYDHKMSLAAASSPPPVETQGQGSSSSVNYAAAGSSSAAPTVVENAPSSQPHRGGKGDDRGSIASRHGDGDELPPPAYE
ncbi:hypothetical protein FRB95_012742 [Tulasnella sp. JGI-2019a]|nr:hypothetical protein FRB95_012742 [Tulasnella sp. JGI-2019a]